MEETSGLIHQAKVSARPALDSNTDGLCDSKYSLNSNNSDYLPLKYKSAPGITVVSPNGGENWIRGTTQMITWTSTGSPEIVC